MSILPQSKVEQVQFCESHAPVWAVAPTTIGLTAAQCTAFAALTTDARKAYDAAQAAKQAYRAAVTKQNDKIAAALQGPGGAADLIRFIKSFAENTANPNAVYGLAQIPPPAVPQPASAPGKPENVSVVLEPSGAVTLSWDAANSAAGTGGFFNVMRKLPGATSFTFLTGVPGSTTSSRRMTFTDFSIPTSAAGTGVQYIMQGRRGALMGTPSDAITVQFGVDGGGMVVSGATLKMAA
jgi:hypothetical protein